VNVALSTLRRGREPPLSSHPVDVGLRTEATITAELLRRGFRVLTPCGANQRYDLVIDLDGEFVRVQCKTGRLRQGVVYFSTQSTQSNTRRCLLRGYRGDVELFVVHCPLNGRFYAVPVDEAPAGRMSLRIRPSMNGQARRVRWAADYELPG
jgi:hypothetical protein